MDDLFALHQIDLQTIIDNAGSFPQVRSSDTLGVLDESAFGHIMQYGQIPIGDLHMLLNKTLKLYHLADPIMLLFEQGQKSVKVSQLFDLLLKGSYYKRLQEQNIVWVLNNRQTPLNIKIIVAAVLAKITGKLTFPQMQNMMIIFDSRERISKGSGVVCQPEQLLGVLRDLNKTVSRAFLLDWIKNSNFQVEGTILPHQFIYLMCFSEDRDVHLRMIPKPNYRRVRNPRTRLYEIQPTKEVAGTPDTKIQKHLKTIVNIPVYKETVEEKKKAHKENIYKSILTKSSKTLTACQALLRDNSIYADIKACLINRDARSPKLVDCINVVKNTRSTTRPHSAIHPIKISQIVSSSPPCFSYLNIYDLSSCAASVRTKLGGRSKTPRVDSRQTRLRDLVRQTSSQLNNTALRTLDRCEQAIQ